MNKKIELAREQGKKIAFDKMAKRVQEDIMLLQEGLKIANDETQLAFHVEKLKEFANKYFNCDFKTHTDDFYVVSIPKFTTAIKKTSALPQDETVDEKPKDDAQQDSENEAIEIAPEQPTPRKSGESWHKEIIDGKEQIVYEDDRWTNRHCFYKKITGVLHTYKTFINADDPTEYLKNIKIGDEICYFDENTKQIKQRFVNSIRTLEKAFSPNSYCFYMRGGDKITYKNFA